MKTSAILRIIILSFVVVFLSVFLIYVINSGGFGSLPFISLGGFGQYTYANEEQYKIGNTEIDGEITDIEIHWIAGSITIEPYDGTTVSVKEEYTIGTGEDDQMRWKAENGKLTVQYRKSGWKTISNDTGKTLVVKIPANMAVNLVNVKIDATSAVTDISGLICTKLEVETVSGNINVNSVKTSEFTGETVSGNLNVTETAADSISYDTVSGRCSVSGSFGKIDSESVSGSTEVYDTVCPTSANLESISGSIKLYIPENEGFTANAETVSGSFTCGFPATINKKNAVYKNGLAKLDFSTISGDASVLKIGEAG